MIIIYHNTIKVTKIVSDKSDTIPFQLKNSVSKTLIDIAALFPEELIFWCNELYEHNLNIADIDQYVHHHKMMLSFNPSDKNYLLDAIGYVEQSPFININKSVRYPTWQMSSAVGVIHTSVLIALKKELQPKQDFDYFLNSLAKLTLPKGLFCYSEPNLLKGAFVNKTPKSSRIVLYRFVKQHYKLRWLFLLLLNELIYEKRIALFPFLQALFYKSKRNLHLDLSEIKVESNLKTIELETIDVVIPTIGRKKYLYDVLCDLRKQTQLPKNVIIVEQNPAENSTSELDYLTNEEWPFTIKHTFTHQPGACNARNIALIQVESEWVFLADDDIRIESKFLVEVLKKLNSINANAASIACFQEKDKIHVDYIFQWNSFGSGCSIVKTTIIQKCRFDMGFEFGFGEDADFGMQIRNLGEDIIFIPFPIIKHLKAPVGGFRSKPKLLWSDEIIQPKPSPTVMLGILKHKSIEQLKGYKTILFFKYYRVQKIKNPIVYFKNFKKQWGKSMYWANQLKNNKNYEI